MQYKEIEKVISIFKPFFSGLTKDAVYRLVYIAFQLAQYDCEPNQLEDAIMLVSKGDRDVAAELQGTLRLVDPRDFERFAHAIASLNQDAVSGFLQDGFFTDGPLSDESSTPESVAKLAVQIMDIQETDSVVDCGSGNGTFLEAAYQAHPEASYTGIEINHYSVGLAKMRSALSGSKISYVCRDMFYDDGLSEALSDDVSFTKVFSNYPFGIQAKVLGFGSRKIQDIQMGHGPFTRPRSADWLFNMQLVDMLKPNGTAIGIMTAGASFNGQDRGAREYFIANGFIKAVIALPSGLFSPYAGIQTSLIVLCTGGSKNVRFVDATDLGTHERRRTVLDDKAIATIIERLNNDSEKSALKSFDEIAQRDFDLSAPRYVEKQLEIPNAVELSSIAINIARGATVKASELDAITCNEETGINYLNLGNISDGSIDDDLPNIKQFDPSLEKCCIHDGDILISKSGSPAFKVAVAEVPEGHRILANGNLYVVSVDREKINPYYLAAFLMSAQGKESLARISVGTTVTNIPIKSLMTMQVPLESKEKQDAVAVAFQAKVDEVKVLKLNLERARLQLPDIFNEEG